MNLDGVRPYCRIVNKKNESISDIAFAHIIKRVKIHHVLTQKQHWFF